MLGPIAVITFAPFVNINHHLIIYFHN